MCLPEYSYSYSYSCGHYCYITDRLGIGEDEAFVGCVVCGFLLAVLLPTCVSDRLVDQIPDSWFLVRHLEFWMNPFWVKIPTELVRNPVNKLYRYAKQKPRYSLSQVNIYVNLGIRISAQLPSVSKVAAAADLLTQAVFEWVGEWVLYLLWVKVAPAHIQHSLFTSRRTDGRKIGWEVT